MTVAETCIFPAIFGERAFSAKPKIRKNTAIAQVAPPPSSSPKSIQVYRAETQERVAAIIG